MDNINSEVQKLKQQAFDSIFVSDFDEAIKNLQSAEVLDSKNPEILTNLGIIYFKKELFTTSAYYFEKLLSLNSGFIDELKILKLLSICYIQSEDINKGMTFIEKALKIKNDDIESLNIKAFCSSKAGDIKTSIHTYRLILKIDKNNKTTLNSYAYLMAKNNIKLNEALNIMKNIYDENNAAYNDTLGFIYLKMNDITNAKKYLKAAQELKPFNSEILEHILLLDKIEKNSL